MEARLLNIAGDWRGLAVVLDDLMPLFQTMEPDTVLGFYRELVRFNDLRDGLREVLRDGVFMEPDDSCA